MREIAYTSFGRNTLFAGLICHIAAILVGMTSAHGGDVFFKMVYPASWAFLVFAGYAELRHRGSRPLSTRRFYLIAAGSVFPLLGPPVVLALIYSASENGAHTGDLTGLFSAILRLRANLLWVFILLLLLFLLFALPSMRNDPYFKRRSPEQNFLHRSSTAGQKSFVKEVSCFPSINTGI